MNMSEELMSKLGYKISFTIPIFGGIPIPNSVLITWIIMAFLVIVSIYLTRGLELVPRRKRQIVAEAIVGFIYNMFYGILGERGKPYITYLGTVFLYLICANVIGLFGLIPPTKDLNTTAGLAIMSIILVEAAGIRQKKMGGWLKSFTHPLPLITPMNILEIGIRPLSLCMRLFGNILGAFIIMELIKYVVPAIVPLVCSAYFDIFDGILQAYVFVFLTSLFIQEAVED